MVQVCPPSARFEFRKIPSPVGRAAKSNVDRVVAFPANRISGQGSIVILVMEDNRDWCRNSTHRASFRPSDPAIFQGFIESLHACPALAG